MADAGRRALQRWLLGQGIAMLAVGLATGIGLAPIGMPMAASLGVIAGLLEFVPFFGPIVTGALIVLLAPVLGLVAVLVLAVLFGALGVLFATPLMVVAMILVKRLYVKEVIEAPRQPAVREP